MDNNNSKHNRRLVTVSIGEELDNEKCAMCNTYMDECINSAVPVTLEEMMRCLGIQPRGTASSLSSPKLN